VKFKQTLWSVLLSLALACTMSGATLSTTTGNLTLDVEGSPLVFEPDPVPNLQITAPFETAAPGDTIAGVLDSFTFTTQPTNFATGLYVVTLGLRPVPTSTAIITVTGLNTFEAVLNAYLTASFSYSDNGCGATCGDILGEFGDILGEFGSLPGPTTCVTAPGTATCEVGGPYTLQGFYAPGPAGGVAALIDVNIAPAAIPEPSSLLLVGLGAAGLIVRRRFYN
jgi:hypothetical protein